MSRSATRIRTHSTCHVPRARARARYQQRFVVGLNDREDTARGSVATFGDVRSTPWTVATFGDVRSTPWTSFENVDDVPLHARRARGTWHVHVARARSNMFTCL